MNDQLSTNEKKLILLLRDIKAYETIDIKCNEKGDISITHTVRNQFLFGRIIDELHRG